MIFHLKHMGMVCCAIFMVGCMDLWNFPKKLADTPRNLVTQDEQFYTLEYQPRAKSINRPCAPDLMLEIEPPTLDITMHNMQQHIAFKHYDVAYANQQWIPLPHAKWEDKLTMMISKALVQAMPPNCLKITRIAHEDAHFRLMSLVREVSIHSGLNTGDSKIEGAKAVVVIDFWIIDLKTHTIAKKWQSKKEIAITNPNRTTQAISALNKAFTQTLDSAMNTVLETVTHQKTP